MKRYNLTGLKFGKLNVIEYAYADERKNAIWNCKCECGSTVWVSSHDLRNGHTQSCGCLQRERADEKVEQLQKKTAFPEEVCGCYLSNYGVKNVCPVSTNGWCKELMKCKVLQQIGGV